MLILQRKAGESLLIGDNVSISIVSVKKGQVRLAISAPVEVPILRSELLAVAEANTDSAIEGADPAALLAQELLEMLPQQPPMGEFIDVYA